MAEKETTGSACERIVAVLLTIASGVASACPTDARHHGANTPEEIAALAYCIILQRDGEPAGLTHHIRLLKAGMPVPELLAGMLDSPEAQGHLAPLPNDAFVEQMYQKLLGRGADSSGKANWINALNQGHSRRDVALGFINSLEFRGYYPWVGFHAPLVRGDRDCGLYGPHYARIDCYEPEEQPHCWCEAQGLGYGMAKCECTPKQGQGGNASIPACGTKSVTYRIVNHRGRSLYLYGAVRKNPNSPTPFQCESLSLTKALSNNESGEFTVKNCEEGWFRLQEQNEPCGLRDNSWETHVGYQAVAGDLVVLDAH